VIFNQAAGPIVKWIIIIVVGAAIAMIAARVINSRRK